MRGRAARSRNAQRSRACRFRCGRARAQPAECIAKWLAAGNSRFPGARFAPLRGDVRLEARKVYVGYNSRAGAPAYHHYGASRGAAELATPASQDESCAADSGRQCAVADEDAEADEADSADAAAAAASSPALSPAVYFFETPSACVVLDVQRRRHVAGPPLGCLSQLSHIDGIAIPAMVYDDKLLCTPLMPLAT